MGTVFAIFVCHIFVCHVNACKRAAFAEEESNNQIDKMIHSVDVSQPLCHPPLSLPNGLKNKVARAAEVKAGMGSAT